jgi:hypothetical protein
MRLSLALAITACLGLLASAQEPTPIMSDAELTAALASSPKGDIGLRLAEFNLSGATGYVVYLYTPTAWIHSLRAKAKEEFRTLTVQDISDEHRSKVWRMRVYPSTPTKFTQQAMNFASDVTHVVIRDEKANQVIQPASKIPFTEALGNALGAKVEYTGQLAIFDEAAIVELWGPKRNKEFVISVVGPNWKYNFTVKKKHFERLTMP